jgi:hypothetical protein
MKKIIILTLLTLTILVPSAGAFTDIDNNHDYSESIYWLNDKGVIRGYRDGTYRPDKYVNRAELIKIVLKTLRKDTSTPATRMYYKDLKKSDWFSRYVNRATELGLISGYEDNRFRPIQYVRAAEAAKIIAKSYDLDIRARANGELWYARFYEALELIDAIPPTVENPRTFLTRGEIAEMIYRVHTNVFYNEDVNTDTDSETDTSTDTDTNSDSDTDAETDTSTDTNTDNSEGDSSAQICEASTGSKCLYVSATTVNGEGTFTAPFNNFVDALKIAEPGDYIYARGGTYNDDNARTYSAARDYTNPPNCYSVDGFCRKDLKAMIPVIDFDGYASPASPFIINNGTQSKKITISSYPNEKAILDMRDTFSTSTRDSNANSAVVISKSDVIVKDFEIVGGMINFMGNNTTRSSVINNVVRDLTIDGGDNPGLIRVERGYGQNGPSEILIEDNELYNFYDIDTPGQIPGTDVEHHGAITVLSRQTYEGYSGGGTGRITIRNNNIHNVPQAFYFKNPMEGPISITGNTFKDSYALGVFRAANLTFSNNTTIDVPNGFWQVSAMINNDPNIQAIDGQNLTFTNNTFVGLNSLLGIGYSRGINITDNIFYGLSGNFSNAIWDTPAYIFVSEYYSDTYPGTEGSIVGEINSDNNCFISTVNDFQMVQRRFSSATTGDFIRIQSFNADQSKQLFGIDQNSTFLNMTNINDVFSNPSNEDYTLKSSVGCN